jgi:hypothetical protein
MVAGIEFRRLTVMQNIETLVKIPDGRELVFSGVNKGPEFSAQGKQVQPGGRGDLRDVAEGTGAVLDR